MLCNSRIFPNSTYSLISRCIYRAFLEYFVRTNFFRDRKIIARSHKAHLVVLHQLVSSQIASPSSPVYGIRKCKFYSKSKSRTKSGVRLLIRGLVLVFACRSVYEHKRHARTRYAQEVLSIKIPNTKIIGGVTWGNEEKQF